MASKTSKTKPRATSRARAKTTPRRTSSPRARAKATSAAPIGPRANGAFAAMTRDYAAHYPADRERRDLYPYTLSGEPIAPL